MDWPEKNRYSEKQPPDKKNKPKYVLKEDYTEAKGQKKETKTDERESKVQKKNVYRQNHNQNRKPKKQFVEKIQQPMLMEKQSSSQQALNCLICSEGIKKRQAIWTCRNCCISLHLRCIKQWIRKTNQDLEGKNHLLFNWSCIQCKTQYNETMPEYYCYCGKYKNPELQRDLEPHSCGQYCKRKRGANCPHLCPQICHSRKCKPCEIEGVKVTCYCGKTQRATKCSEDRPIFQCGKKCQKMLNCAKHKCERNCHQGQCYPCKKKKMAQCYCGKNDQVIDCAESSYQCQEACGKLLDCGYHNCQEDCHPGSCGSCKKTPQLQKNCPCGRYSLMMISELQRESCKDPIPSCGMPCKKKLPCGHQCTKMCHQGKCPECKVMVVQKCHCNSIQRKIQCFRAKITKEQFKCDTICKKKRSCGQHNCNTQCCKFRTSPFAQDHTCELTCQRMLNCQKHTCDMPCHAGLCKKCPVIYSQPQPCPCGSTSLKPPVICGVLTPECGNVCNKIMQCGHKCRQLCHYGPCRCVEEVSVSCRCEKQKIQTTCGREALCLNKCQKQLPCGHKCLVQCHSGKCQDWIKGSSCSKKCNKIREDCGHNCKMICHTNKKCEQFTCEAEILIKCQCGHRQKQVLCESKGLNEKGNKKVKQIVCNQKCENLKRFDILYKGKEIYYTNAMIQFGFKNWNYLIKIQQKLENFILKSDEHFIEIDFKLDNHSRVTMLNLFENHYHLNTHFYRHMKGSSFTLLQTESTMVPNPCLSQYIKKVSKGEIKRTNLPFQYTIKFEPQSKQRVDAIFRTLKHFIHKYYTERKQKFVHIHFWEKNQGIKAYYTLQETFVNVQFKSEENIVERDGQDESQQVYIAEEEIVETQVIKQQHSPKIQKQQQVFQNIQKKQNVQDSQKQDYEQNNVKKQFQINQPTQEKKLEKGKVIITTKPVKKGTIVVKKPSPFMIPLQYPESSTFVQDIYNIDSDQLFGDKIKWQSDIIDKLIVKKMGIQASQWRIRALIMISLFMRIENQEAIMNEQFSRIVQMYQKDKKKAKRILSIQKIDYKKVKQQMESNHIYLSDHEPQILSYFILHNYLAVDKQEILPSQQCASTKQIQRAIQILENLEQSNFEQFYQAFKAADYVFACALKPFVYEIRKRFLKDLVKKKRVLSENLWQYLLFDSEQELIAFAQINKLKIHKKFSKSLKKDNYVLTEGELPQQIICAGLQNYEESIIKKIHQKRDVKYFISEPDQLIDDRWMIRSFFAFGDFRQNVNKKYMHSLCKKLKEQEQEQ